MASGITHIMLTKMLQDKMADGPLKDTLAFGSDFLIVGAVAPDLPYASIADSDFFLTSESPLADDFHYKNTNQIPLNGFVQLRNQKKDLDEKVLRRMFCFILGYASHVLADGIIHPFVRDKVGNYQGHESAHRSLEMQLDVLFVEWYSKNTGLSVEFNYSKIHDELLNFQGIKGSSETRKLFRDLIRQVYLKSYPDKKISGWIEGLHRLFAVAEGEHPKIYRVIEANTIFYKNKEDIIPEKVLVLKEPIDGIKFNFLHVEEINFLEDCIPKFFEKLVPLAQKAYDFVFDDGPSITELDIPPINLDTGRLIGEVEDLSQIPELWK